MKSLIVETKLIETKLTAEQAQIVFYFEMLQKICKMVDVTKKIEVIEQSQESEIVIDWLTFFKDDQNDLWVCGSVEMTSSGSYWEPPDYDFMEIYAQKQDESLQMFCLTVFQVLIADRFDIILQCEGEAQMDYELAKFCKDYEAEIPF